MTRETRLRLGLMAMLILAASAGTFGISYVPRFVSLGHL